MIERALSKNISSDLGLGKAIIILGPRQVGKTTLVKEIASRYPGDHLYLNGDLSAVQELLAERNLEAIRRVIGENQLVILDEAQRIAEIGLKLKIITDELPNVQLLVTGSSSLDLSFGLSESLTGRKFEHYMHPISYGELVANWGPIRAKESLEARLRYGSYPEVVNNPGKERRYLDLIADSYLYRDLIDQSAVRRVALLKKILQALAFQVGNEVSYNEVARTVGADRGTVESYIDLLEKAFVIFRLPSLSRNLRNEIKQGRKVYFWDNGIRNALIANFNPLTLRQDTGGLWENFLVAERQKLKHYSQQYANCYFWRTYTQQEIDYIEEADGKIRAYEFKWNPKKRGRMPKIFAAAYPNSEIVTVNRDNFVPFLSEF